MGEGAMTMRRPAVLFTLAALLSGAYLASSVLGGADHTSAIAGMPATSASWTLGPLHIALYMAFVVIAPILAIAGTIDTLLLLRAQHRSAEQGS